MRYSDPKLAPKSIFQAVKGFHHALLAVCSDSPVQSTGGGLKFASAPGPAAVSDGAECRQNSSDAVRRRTRLEGSGAASVVETVPGIGAHVIVGLDGGGIADETIAVGKAVAIPRRTPAILDMPVATAWRVGVVCKARNHNGMVYFFVVAPRR